MNIWKQKLEKNKERVKGMEKKQLSGNKILRRVQEWEGFGITYFEDGSRFEGDF